MRSACMRPWFTPQYPHKIKAMSRDTRAEYLICSTYKGLDLTLSTTKTNCQASAIPTVALRGLREALGCRTSLKVLKWITSPTFSPLCPPFLSSGESCQILGLDGCFSNPSLSEAIRILYPGRDVLVLKCSGC